MQELKIYNSLTKKKELFKPIIPNHVGLYVCGPTVYSDVHLGNVRTFVSFDVVYRYLKFIGYNVRYVRNITDVGHLLNDADSGEDKIAKQAKLLNLEPMEVVQHYTNGFRDVMSKYNNISPSIEPTATGHIVEQIEMVQEILDEGFAYVSNGSVYFDVEKYNLSHNYGKLSGRKIEDLLSNTRELDGQEEKRNPLDFAIWKKADDSHIMKWNSPWGEGFPGWHLECSVMSTKYLGEKFDIHGGGIDLKFPHHECEIAQNVGAGNGDPVNYWMHGNMLTVNGQKMSKSAGNGFTPEQLATGDHPLLDKGYSEMVVRFFMLQSHYTSTLDFSNEALKGSEKGFEKMLKAYETLKTLVSSKESSVNIDDLKNRCYEAMNDDFNTPILIAHLFDGVKMINNVKDGRDTISGQDLALLNEIFDGFLVNVLGIKIETENNQSVDLSNDIMNMVLEIRNQAKQDKNYQLADEIRNRLTEINITIKDSKEGTSWELN